MIVANKIKNTFLILLLIILSSCIRSNAVIEKQEDIKNTSENMPVWYLNEDEWGSVISSVGTATSQDLQMSYDKALLIAKKNLAAKIKSFVSSEIDNINEVNSIDGKKENINSFKEKTYQYISQEISGYKVTNKKIIPLSNTFRTYIRISYDSKYAREIIINKVKENSLINKIE